MAKTEEQKKAEAKAKEEAQFKANYEKKVAEEEAKLKAKAKAEAKALTQAEAELEAEEKAKAEAEVEADEEADDIERERKSLGIAESKIGMAGFKSKKPHEIEKEVKRHAELVKKRTINRIAKAKTKVKAGKMGERKLNLTGRLKAVRSRTRPNTYSEANLKAWIEELNMINNNPKGWAKQTKNGTIPYTPGTKKKKSQKDIIDSMDLD